MPKPGDRFGDFVLLDELGRGAMGVVWNAKQESLGREVALKVLGEAYAADPVWIARFRAEAGAAARLSHPGILPVYAVGETQGLPWFAMEKVDGRDLTHRTGSAPRASWDEIARWVRDAALALQHAHEHGVVHRDIKPANLMLRSDGRLVLTDFGLSKRMGSGSLTTTGLLVGTPYYMSPELVAGRTKDVGPGTDVYGLGVTLYELMTGHPPFLAENAVALIRLITDQEPVPPSKEDPRVPRDLETIALVCLAKRPEKRYGTAKELAEDLERFLAHEPIARRRPGLGERIGRFARRNRIALAVAGVGALALGALTLLFEHRMASQERGYREEIERMLAEADAAADAGDQEQADAIHAAIESRAAKDAAYAQDKALATAKDLLADLKAGRPLRTEYQREIEGWATQAPAHVTLAADAPGVTVLGKRFVVGDTSAPVPLKLAGEDLVPGVWRLQVSAPGRLRTTLVVLAAPGLAGSLPLRLPPSGGENANMLSYGGAWFPVVKDGKASGLEASQAPYLLASSRVTARAYSLFLAAQPEAERKRLEPAGWAAHAPRGAELDAPVAGLSRAQAEAYAKAQGARLPRERELINAVGAGRTQAILKRLRENPGASAEERMNLLREASRVVSAAVQKSEGFTDWDGRPEWALSEREGEVGNDRPWPVLADLAAREPGPEVGLAARVTVPATPPKRPRRATNVEARVLLRLARSPDAP